LKEREDYLSNRFRNTYPFPAVPNCPGDVVRFPLPRYTSKGKGVGMIFAGNPEGVYRRISLWELELTAGKQRGVREKARSTNSALSKVSLLTLVIA
jgi:hypothetical protein